MCFALLEVLNLKPPKQDIIHQKVDNLRSFVTEASKSVYSQNIF